MDDSEKVVYLGVIMSILVTATFLGYNLVSYPQPDPVLSIALLNDEQVGESLPTNLTINETFVFHSDVGNYGSYAELLSVHVKLGNHSILHNGTNPAPFPEVFQIERIVQSDTRWITQIVLNMTETGINQRLIVELWRFDQQNREYVYTSRWVSHTFNVSIS